VHRIAHVNGCCHGGRIHRIKIRTINGTTQVYSFFAIKGCHRVRVQLIKILCCNYIRLRRLGIPAQSLDPDYSGLSKHNNIDQVKWRDVFQIKIYLNVCCKQNSDGLLCFL